MLLDAAMADDDNDDDGDNDDDDNNINTLYLKRVERSPGQTAHDSR